MSNTTHDSFGENYYKDPNKKKGNNLPEMVILKSNIVEKRQRLLFDDKNPQKFYYDHTGKSTTRKQFRNELEWLLAESIIQLKCLEELNGIVDVNSYQKNQDPFFEGDSIE